MGLELPRVIGRVSKPLWCCLSATKGLFSDDEQDCCRDLGLGDGLGCRAGQQTALQGQQKQIRKKKLS